MYQTSIESFWSPKNLKKQRHSLRQIDLNLDFNRKLVNFHRKRQSVKLKRKHCIITSQYFQRPKKPAPNSFMADIRKSSEFTEISDIFFQSSYNHSKKTRNPKLALPKPKGLQRKTTLRSGKRTPKGAGRAKTSAPRKSTEKANQLQSICKIKGGSRATLRFKSPKAGKKGEAMHRQRRK